MRKYMNLEMICTCIILLYIAVLAGDGYLVSKLPGRAIAFPRFVFLLSAILGALEIRRIKRSVDANNAKPPEERKKAKPVLDHAGNFREIVILTIGYFAAMYVIGFFLSSVLFAVIYAYRRKYSRMLQISIISVVIIFAWYYLFERMLGVNLPAGYLMNLFK